jgi:hypothetical protein
LVSNIQAGDGKIDNLFYSAANAAWLAKKIIFFYEKKFTLSQPGSSQRCVLLLRGEEETSG